MSLYSAILNDNDVKILNLTQTTISDKIFNPWFFVPYNIKKKDWNKIYVRMYIYNIYMVYKIMNKVPF